MTPTDPRREAFEKVADELVKMTFSTPPHIKYVTDARNELLRLYDEALEDAASLAELGGWFVERELENEYLEYGGYLVSYTDDADLGVWREDADDTTPAEQMFNDEDFASAFAWLARAAASSTTDKGAQDQ